MDKLKRGPTLGKNAFAGSSAYSRASIAQPLIDSSSCSSGSTSPLANYVHGQVLNVTGGMFGGMYT